MEIISLTQTPAITIGFWVIRPKWQVSLHSNLDLLQGSSCSWLNSKSAAFQIIQEEDWIGWTNVTYIALNIHKHDPLNIVPIC